MLLLESRIPLLAGPCQPRPQPVLRKRAPFSPTPSSSASESYCRCRSRGMDARGATRPTGARRNIVGDGHRSFVARTAGGGVRAEQHGPRSVPQVAQGGTLASDSRGSREVPPLKCHCRIKKLSEKSHERAKRLTIRRLIAT